MSLEALMGHLEPSDNDLKALAKAAEASVQKETRKIGMVNLAAKSTEVLLLLILHAPMKPFFKIVRPRQGSALASFLNHLRAL